MLSQFLCLALALPSFARESNPLVEVRAELEQLKSPHTWAGAYLGPGAFSSESLYLAPSGRYCLVTFYDAGPAEEGNCGRLRLDGDRFVTDGRPQKWEKEDPEGPPYLRVAWDGRNYLVPERRVLGFINAVNEADEPNYRGMFRSTPAFLRSAESKDLITGQPVLPARYQALLLKTPLVVTAVAVSSRTNVITRVHRYETEDCGAEARFDAGASSGIFVGMKLNALSGDVQASAVVENVTDSSSSGRIRQDDCDASDPIAEGSKFSSRHAWTLNVVLSSEPMKTEVHHASGKRFPLIFEGPPEDFLTEDFAVGAAEEGFSFEEVGAVAFTATYPGVMSLDSFKEVMDRTILSLGGNAFLDPRDLENEKRAEEAGGIETRRLRILRVSYRGRVVDSALRAHFLPLRRGEHNHIDWKTAALGIQADRCGKAQAGRTVAQETALSVLHWDQSMLARAANLRFEDLTDEQRRAIEPFVPEARRHGRVWPALWDTQADFRSHIGLSADQAEADYKRAHPVEAAECERLKDAAFHAEFK